MRLPEVASSKLPVGVVEVREQPVTVSFQPWKQEIDHGLVAGAMVHLRYEVSDPKSGDETIAQGALEISLLVANRVVSALAFASDYPREVPPLLALDLHDLGVEEDQGLAGRRTLPPVERRPIRVVHFKGSISKERVEHLLARGRLGTGDAEALWSDALEAAYDQRPREAVVAARAAVEVCWEAVARARTDASIERESIAVRALLVAHLDEALLPRTSVLDRLDRYSRSLLGFSLKDEWAERWDELGTFFAVRNRGAHGGGVVTQHQALHGVRLSRDVIDRLDRARPK